MQRVQLSELNDSVRAFLSDVFDRGGVIIENDSGHGVGGVMPYRDPTPQQRQRANESLERLQRKAQQAMQEHGVTEADVMRVILEDDER